VLLAAWITISEVMHSGPPGRPVPLPVLTACAHRPLIVTPLAETTRDTIEDTFTKFTRRDDVGLIIMNQNIADQIRSTVTNHRAPVPMVLEIPSKDSPYDPSKDALMKRVLQMLGEE
jgi:ATP synthase F subunit